MKSHKIISLAVIGLAIVLATAFATTRVFAQAQESDYQYCLDLNNGDASACNGFDTTAPGTQTPAAPATGGQAPIAPATGGQAPVSKSTTFTLQSPLDPKVTSIGGLVQTFIDVISYILILFAVLMLVYTGLQYILAQGNSERIKELHKKLLWIVVGVAIVIGARVIIEVVINTLSAAHVINSSTFNQVQSAATGK